VPEGCYGAPFWQVMSQINCEPAGAPPFGQTKFQALPTGGARLG
jgi:hypothetical protein